MDRKTYEALAEKIPEKATFSEVKAMFTMEEVVGILMYEGCDTSCLKDGDERLVASIIRTLSEGSPSHKRCIALLEATKEVLGYYQRLII